MAHFECSNFAEYNHSSYQSLISEKATLLKREAVLNIYNDVENFKFVHTMKKLNIVALNDSTFE